VEERNDHADLFQNEEKKKERSDGAVMRLSILIFGSAVQM